MKKILLYVLASLCLFGASAFAQVSNSNFTGTVTDSSKAVLPGVTVTATNNATGVAVSNVTNDAGAYTILSIIPGTYTVTAELPGFRKEVINNADLVNGVTVRLNFTMQVASQSQSVEVTVAADTLIQQSSQTVGTVLGEKKVSDLPLIGNNILDQLSVLGGLDNLVQTGANPSSGNAFGREGTTLAGISAQDVPVIRDGIMVQDTRWPTGLNTNTVINPDLVGEVKLIVAPVDAELGRGNGAVQISTRSGTNQFRGAAVWNLQNSFLNANTWAQNETHTPLNWLTQNQGTISGGGPIIKNKTFFYALWDMYYNRQRAYTSAPVLTPCAKNGIYRYFDGWNNAGANATVVSGGPTPTRPSVDLLGNPVAPGLTPSGTPSQLEYKSVFGTLPGNLPAANADCSNIAALVTPNTAFDTFRTHPDTTGLISRTNALFPTPNDFNALNLGTYDGLNLAGYRYLRGFRGLDNLFSVGEAAGDRKQINFRVDHNFNQRHRAFVNFSYERTNSDDTLAALPGTWSNNNYHHPLTVAVNFTSTLSASMVNEARFGYKFSGTNVLAPWDLPANQAGINKYLPTPVNGVRILPDIVGAIGACSPITGARPPGNCTPFLGAGGGNLTTTSIDRSPVWTYGDSLSLTKGKHTMKVGAEIRAASSETQGSTPFGGFFTLYHSDVTVLAGSAVNAPLATSTASAIASTNPNFATIGSSDAGRARNILNYLAGSLSSLSNEYFLNKASDTQFCDYRCTPLITDTIAQREFDIFFKDDYKVRKNLTLNLGLRYDWYGVPWSPQGVSAAPTVVGGAFGIGGTNFSAWMNPNAANGSQTVFQFVGKNSPNSGKLPYQNDWHNFGPAVGFAYQLPFLGEGKTTIRGGYQITYQGGSRFNDMQQPLNGPPGRVYQSQYVGNSAQPYLDLTSLSAANVPTPLPAGVAPMTPLPVTDRTQTANFFDPTYTSPYVQNLVLSVQRQIRPNVTASASYIGTLGRKLYTTMNLNLANFLYNGLASDFASIRNGTDNTPTLNKILNGVNLCTAISGCTATPGVTYGPIGTPGNTAAVQMRASPSFQGNLAAGNWNSVATTLNTLDYTQFGCPNAGGAGNCGLPSINSSTTRGAVLRVNGMPENFIYTNPQFATATYLANMATSNYHSLQTEVTLRPTHGFSGTINYTFSKNLGLPTQTSGSYTNPVNRHLDYTIVNNNHTHIIRSNGNIDLPIGPGKLLLGQSHGFLGHAIEGWRAGGIWTLSSGGYVNITGQNNLYGNGTPDIANAALFKELLGDGGTKWGVSNGSQLEGDFFDRTKWIKVPDPQCANVTPLQNLNGFNPPTGGAGTARCTLQAIARIVPQGTAGAIANIDGKGTTGAYVLVNPQPGTQGNLGFNPIRGIAPWRFDGNLAKAFKITESKSLQFRMDVFNVLNSAQVSTPGLGINGSTTPFGEITQKGGANSPRTFQGQLRLNF